MRAFDAGWGGVVTKTIGLHPVVNVAGPKTKFLRTAPETTAPLDEEAARLGAALVLELGADLRQAARLVAAAHRRIKKAHPDRCSSPPSWRAPAATRSCALADARAACQDEGRRRPRAEPLVPAHGPEGHGLEHRQGPGAVSAVEPGPRAHAALPRTWSTYHIAALWIGMSVVITTYTLASGLMQQGMTWWQAMLTILLGNLIVLVPMILNAHAGTKYGVSFPVLCRASFRRQGRERAGTAARAGRLRLVRHPDLDRRARAERAADGGMAAMGRRRRQRLDRVRRLLAGPGLGHHARPRGHQAARRLVGAAAARRRGHPARVGRTARRRARLRPRRIARLQSGTTPFWRSSPPRSRPTSATGRRSASTSPTSPATRAASARRCWARRSACRDDDGVRVHRGRRHERDDCDLRRGDLGPGRSDRPDRQPPVIILGALVVMLAQIHQHGGQRRVAGQRLLEPRAAAHQLRHRAGSSRPPSAF
jgi:hypothetical protein